MLRQPHVYRIMDTKKLQHITYRGEIRGCNYRCPYCVFACKEGEISGVERDKKALKRLIDFLRQGNFFLSVLIAPYGEALLHGYYIAALAEISKLPTVAKISCQTNLSLSAADFLEKLGEAGAQLEKIGLWASFHPSMVDYATFGEKANRLSQSISISVGAVGDPTTVDTLGALRKTLDPSIYLWVNKMDGLKRKYTQAEGAEFSAIDPLFSLELSGGKNYSHCSGGRESIFLTGEGSVFPCVRSKKNMGNLYSGSLSSLADCGGRCDCFLAYGNRRDIPQLAKLSPHPQLRLPRKAPLKAVFFDVDDSVYFSKSPEKTRAAQAFLMDCHQRGLQLFPITALTKRQAQARLGEVRACLSGGVFAYGAHVEIAALGFKKMLSFGSPPPFPPKRAFLHKDGCYKLLVKENLGAWAHYGAVYTETQIAVVPQGAAKEIGAREIIEKLGFRPNEILILGNDLLDIPLFALGDTTVALEGAPKEVCQRAGLVLSPEALSGLLLKGFV